MSVALVTRDQPGEKGLPGVCVRVCGYSCKEAWKHRRAASRSRAGLVWGRKKRIKQKELDEFGLRLAVPRAFECLFLSGCPFLSLKNTNKRSA